MSLKKFVEIIKNTLFNRKEPQLNEDYIIKVSELSKPKLKSNVIVNDGEILPIMTFSWREL